MEYFTCIVSITCSLGCAFDIVTCILCAHRQHRARSHQTSLMLHTHQFNLNGSTAKGKLIRKSSRGSPTSPLWVVAPDGLRRKVEEVPEKALGKLILPDTDAKSTRLIRSSVRVSPSSHSDGNSVEEVHQAKKSPRTLFSTRKSRRSSGTGTDFEEHSAPNKKRKHDGSNMLSSCKSHRVTFQDGKRSNQRKVLKVQSVRPQVREGQIGTRSSSNGDHSMSELTPATKPKNQRIKNTKSIKVKNNKGKVSRRSDHVKVIKMLTGTLYLYRGETRRAEFVRSKY